MTEPNRSSGPDSPRHRAWKRFLANRPACVSAIYLSLLVLAAILGPMFSSYSQEQISELQFDPPSLQHWFGTDLHGRDLLVRLLEGARISLLVGIVGAGVSLVIGVTWGAVAGYVGGRWDGWMMRGVDILYSLPSIIFVIVLITSLEALIIPSLEKALGPDVSGPASRLLFLFVGLGAVSWLTMARIVRGQVLTLKQRPFVDASLALGAGHAHILWRHILPNILGVVIVYLTLTVPAIILYESFLSYLGLGINPPMASWGSLISEGAQQLNPVKIYWWLLLFPAAMLVTALLALNFLGDGLRDALDPKSGF